jgi:outer membrane autotransporter protein
MKQSIDLDRLARRAGTLCRTLAALTLLVVAGLAHMSQAFAQTFTANVPQQQPVGLGEQVNLRVTSIAQFGRDLRYSVVSGAARIISQDSANLDSTTRFAVALVQAPAAPGASVIQARCIPTSGDASCGTLNFTLYSGVVPQTEVQGALQAFGSLARSGVDATNVQLTNLQNRLRDRRGGAGGLSLYGASLNNGNSTISGTALQSLVSYLGAGDSNNPAQQQLDVLGRWGVFVNGQASLGTKDTTSNETGYRAKTGGITVGADYRFTDDLVAGAALGFVHTRSNFDSAVGQSNTTGASFSLFGTYYHQNGFYIDSIANLGWNGYETDRNVSSGAVANGSTRGLQGAISVSSGYEVNHGALAFGPYVRASYIRVQVDDFSETGADAFNVHSDAQSLTSLTSNLGLQASYAISTSWGVLSPNARVEWEHQFRDNSRLLTGSLVIDPQQQIFTVATDNPDRNYFNLALGLAAQFARGRSAFISYETVLGRSTVANHAVTAGVRFEF